MDSKAATRIDRFLSARVLNTYARAWGSVRVWQSFMLAVGAMASSALVVFLLQAVLDRTFYQLLMLGVVLSTWLGGTASGVLAALLGALILNYFFQEPLFSFSVANTGDAVQLVLFVLAGLIVSYVVRDHMQTRAALTGQARALEVLRERERIAMDLHDGLIQSLYASMVKLASVRRQLPSGAREARDALELASQQLASDIGNVRNYIDSLRSAVLTDVDIKSKLLALVDSLRPPGGLVINVEVEEPVDMEPGLEGDFLYIAGEALSNAIRHARASTVTLRVMPGEEGLVLRVKDNGCGFDPGMAARGDGLRNMEARAAAIGARLILDSAGQGTTVELTVWQHQGKHPKLSIVA
jgi:signal transduction histidine kinase